MKLRKILDSKEAIKNLSDLLLDKAEDNYAIYKVLLEVNKSVENYETQRIKIMKKYGEVNKDGSVYVSRESKNFPICIKELNALEEVEVDIVLPKIIVKPEALKLRPVDWYHLIDIGILEEYKEEGENNAI